MWPCFRSGSLNLSTLLVWVADGSMGLVDLVNYDVNLRVVSFSLRSNKSLWFVNSLTTCMDAVTLSQMD